MQKEPDNVNKNRFDLKAYILLCFLVMLCPPIGLAMGVYSFVKKTDWRGFIGIPAFIIGAVFSAIYIHTFLTR